MEVGIVTKHENLRTECVRGGVTFTKSCGTNRNGERCVTQSVLFHALENAPPARDSIKNPENRPACFSSLKLA